MSSSHPHHHPERGDLSPQRPPPIRSSSSTTHSGQDSSVTASSTLTLTETETHHHPEESGSSVRLVLKKPQYSKKVNWTNETVDNEHMGKRKSKCCCIYKKPHVFGESSSESEDDECENCFGHCELRKNNNDPPPPPPPSVPPVS